MAPLVHSTSKKVPLLYLTLLLFITSSLISAQPRRLLLEDDQYLHTIKNKSNSTTKNPIKPTTTSTSTPSKNQTKLIKPTPTSNSLSSKNQTKVITKATSSSNSTIKSQFKKLNSTSKISQISTKKTSDAKIKTINSNPTKESKTQIEKSVLASKSNEKSLKKPSWFDQEEEDDDLVEEFRQLPSKFQESIVPDLEKISQTSRTYLNKYNKEFTRGFKPYVGNKYASKFAYLVSFTFITIPLILVSLIFTRIKAFFSLQKLLIFVQIYLSIYFAILAAAAVATGLEPLRFFYYTSRSTYACVQVVQSSAYVLYLLLLLMYLVLVFSTGSGPVSKLLGLAQTFVGFAVGLHYYVTVFHRAVMHQPPKTNWRAHALYATCFLVICLLARGDRRKKAYLEEGGEEGKKS